ncbi:MULTISPECIES: response regulator [Polyangium]|uniref:Response regulator n=2 Tax=Polyangium TaxID=55 RepID=A0A4U1J1G3_9BACT|nr:MULTISPECIES: response regulator [Polyangium]MDI1427894.1 response regulator [Polyangium sorediatum]TKD00217.1 response regulator [Polyangium fumosum]
MRTWRPRPPVVLVVDDDPDILRLLGMCLEAEGCEVRETMSPGAALERLDRVDVVVVDQRMPEMNGTDFIEAARSRGYDCRFLVISGKRGARAEAAQAGAEGFLAKPIGMRDLIGEVERLFYLGFAPPSHVGTPRAPTSSAPSSKSSS